MLLGHHFAEEAFGLALIAEIANIREVINNQAQFANFLALNQDFGSREIFGFDDKKYDL